MFISIIINFYEYFIFSDDGAIQRIEDLEQMKRKKIQKRRRGRRHRRGKCKLMFISIIINFYEYFIFSDDGAIQRIEDLEQMKRKKIQKRRRGRRHRRGKCKLMFISIIINFYEYFIFSDDGAIQRIEDLEQMKRKKIQKRRRGRRHRRGKCKLMFISIIINFYEYFIFSDDGG